LVRKLWLHAHRPKTVSATPSHFQFSAKVRSGNNILVQDIKRIKVFYDEFPSKLDKRYEKE